MSRRSRAEIRRLSLRAAAKVALFAGTMACGTEAVDSLAVFPADTGSSPDATHASVDVGGPDTGVSADAHTLADAGFDAGPADLGPADLGPADTGVGCGTFPQDQEAFEAWEACCAENFDDPGCQVWGPPAPPSMEVA